MKRRSKKTYKGITVSEESHRMLLAFTFNHDKVFDMRDAASVCIELVLSNDELKLQLLKKLAHFDE